MPLVFARFLTRPTGRLVFVRFVRAGLVPAGGLVGILGPGKLIVLQRKENVHRAFVPRLFVFGAVCFTLSWFVGAGRRGAYPSGRVVPLESSYHAFWF